MNSMSVSHFSVLFVLASLLFQSGVVRSDAGLIWSVCAKTPFPALCISSLNSSPKSASSTHVPDLGLVMVDVLTAKANAAIDTIKKLLATRPDLTDPLTYCLDVYSDGIVSEALIARKAFSTGHFKFAFVGGRDVALGTDSCESRFAQGQSPLTATNNDVQDVAYVIAGIAQKLL